MALNTINNTRLEMRIPSSVKQTLERAASLNGKTLSSYAINELLESAERDIREYESVTLNQQERERFLELMTNPPEPNAALKKLMRG